VGDREKIIIQTTGGKPVGNGITEEFTHTIIAEFDESDEFNLADGFCVVGTDENAQYKSFSDGDITYVVVKVHSRHVHITSLNEEESNVHHLSVIQGGKLDKKEKDKEDSDGDNHN
jgi:hypothetical protein